MRGDRLESPPVVGVAGALVAVACCAGLPLLSTILGGLTVATVFGVAGGILLIVGALGVAGCGTRPQTPSMRSLEQGGGAVTVELLYFDGCPNHEALVPHLEQLLAGAQVTARLALRRIADDEAAQAERFVGSPTVRVDGRDVEPGAHEREDFGLKCRLYRVPSGLQGSPLDEWVLDALARART